jgi:hypothetical protein
LEALHSTGQRDRMLIFCFADHGKQALSHGLVESNNANWELYNLHFFFPVKFACKTQGRARNR